MKWLGTGMLALCMVSGAACGAGAHSVNATTVASGASCNRVANLEQQVSQIYDTARVRHAAPLYTTRFVARAIQPRELIGAELYVDAEPGMNQPYMERVLSCYAAAGSFAHPNDPLAAANIRDLDVRVQGHQYVISVTGADRHAGKEIWQRAAALLESGGRIEVQQLSAADSTPAM